MGEQNQTTCVKCGTVTMWIGGVPESTMLCARCADVKIARLTSERDRAVALVRDVAVAFGEWSTTPDEFVSARLLEAMASCQEFVADEPPKGGKP